jgi:PAS domain S-box-containing protein
MKLQRSTSLVRRVVEHYLMFALAGIFIVLVAAIGLSNTVDFHQIVGIVAAIPLTLIVIGAYVLRRTTSVNNEIEQQLLRFQQQGVPGLEPLPMRGTVANSWNTLIKAIHKQEIWDGVERRLNESLALGEAKRWQELFQQLPDGIAVTSNAGQILQVNPALHYVLGRSEDEQLTGQSWWELLAKFKNAENTLAWDRLIESQASIVVELKRGTQLEEGVLRVARYAWISSNATEQVIWIVRDITQQKLAEDARNQFVFTATHELRTPLANIRAYSETLAGAGDIPIEQQQEFYNIINSEASRLARFVDELLNISQLEAGTITAKRSEVDVERLVNEVLDNIRPQALAKQQRLEVKLPAKFPKFKADKDKFSSALVNLLGNAIKYTPEHGQVDFQLEVEANQLSFHVRDNGIGIAADELSQLGNKFFRSHDPRVQSKTGSGIGLAFTQEVARLHGGQLRVQSELDKGSQFTLVIPI